MQLMRSKIRSLRQYWRYGCWSSLWPCVNRWYQVASFKYKSLQMSGTVAGMTWKHPWPKQMGFSAPWWTLCNRFNITITRCSLISLVLDLLKSTVVLRQLDTISAIPRCLDCISEGLALKTSAVCVFGCLAHLYIGTNMKSTDLEDLELEWTWAFQADSDVLMWCWWDEPMMLT